MAVSQLFEQNLTESKVAKSFPEELIPNLKALEIISKKKKLSISALESCPVVSASQWKVGKELVLKEADVEQLWTAFLHSIKEGAATVDVQKIMGELMWKKIISNRVSQELSDLRIPPTGQNSLI